MRIQYEKLHVPFDQVPISHEQMEPGKKKDWGQKRNMKKMQSAKTEGKRWWWWYGNKV